MNKASFFNKVSFIDRRLSSAASANRLQTVSLVSKGRTSKNWVSLMSLLAAIFMVSSVAKAEVQEFSNIDNAPIPDDAKKQGYSLIDTSNLPKDSKIDKISYRFRIFGDDACTSDYKVKLIYFPLGDIKAKKYLTAFDGSTLEGKCTDENIDQDEENDNDIVMELEDDSVFKQLTAHGKWYLAVRDSKSGNQGEIAYFRLSVDYQKPEEKLAQATP